jgi:hypothetical protein
MLKLSLLLTALRHPRCVFLLKFRAWLKPENMGICYDCYTVPLYVADIIRVNVTNTNTRKSLHNLILCYSLLIRTEPHTHKKHKLTVF